MRALRLWKEAQMPRMSNTDRKSFRDNTTGRSGADFTGKDSEAVLLALADSGRAARGGQICRRICAGLLSGVLMLSLIGCSETESELPDLSSLGEITAIAREEGSGTRSEFESLVDTTEAGANTVALSTEDVLAAVEGDENAIGYLAYSAIDSDYAGSAKVLTVDGVSCSLDTISDGDYPLSRDYILAYSGTLSDLEADFLEYVLGAGQTVVAETCTPVRTATVYLSDQLSGTITICGSSSMETLMEDLIAGYAAYNPNAEIILEVSDSTEGLNAAMRGECDLAMSSRSLKDYEEELLNYKVIAADGVAVIVNEENPLEDISLSRLKKIYDGEVLNWGDLQ